MSVPCLDGIEDHLVTSLGADFDTQPELAPLFHYQGPMDLDLNEEHFEEQTEHDLVPSAVESMAALPVNMPRMRRPVESRGHNRAKWARNGIPERMGFNNNGQPVELAAIVARFSRFLGMIAQESSLFPINTKDWRAFHAGANIDNAWMRIRGTIDWSDPITLSNEPNIRHVVEIKLNDRWKHYKGELKKKWYTPFIGTEQRFSCGDLRVNVHQWNLLVTDWDLPHNQERSVKAKRNRRECQVSHTCGSKSFAQVRFEYAENLAKQEVIILRLEATEREHRWSLEASNLVENLRKEQAETINRQRNQMELEIVAIKRRMIEFMTEFKNCKGKDKVEDGSPIAELQTWLNKVDIGTAACSPSEISRDEEYEVVEMDSDEGALPSMPQGKPNK